MPRRETKPEVVEAPEEKKAAPKRGPARKSEAVDATAAPAKGEKKTVKKFPMLEKAKKFLEKVSKGLSAEVFDAREIEAGKTGEQKRKIVFLNFCTTPKSEDHEELSPEEDAHNIERIKEVLFYYHTGKDDTSEDAIVLQVISPETEDGFHLLAYQELVD